MKKTLILLLFIVLILGQILFTKDVLAEEEAAVGDGSEIYKFPEIKPEYSLKAGYRFVNIKGSYRADEYEYSHNSLSLSGQLVMFPFPHRVYLEVDVLNKKEHFGDIRYAYKDIVLSRWIRRTVFHNLDNITLVDLDGVVGSTDVDVRDSGVKYGVKISIDTMFLRLKTPDFPLHVYVDGRFISKKGTIQQMFIGGSGGRGGIATRVSEKRTLDWSSDEITLGINSHLGVVELDLSHGEKRFDSKDQKVMEYFYTPGTSGRAAGTYPHHLIPTIEGSTNTLKVHTSYTGRLVASSTVSWTKRENNDSGAKADYFIGAGEITWLPLTNLTMLFKYRHRESDIDNPDTLPAGYLGYSNYTVPLTGIRNSISSKTDNLSWIVRYKAMKGLTLNMKYSYDQHKKGAEVTNEWDAEAQDLTRKSTLNLSADAKPLKALKLKAVYEHREIDKPSHNTEPGASDSGSVSATWNPVKRVNAFLNCQTVREKRTDIHYVHPSSGTHSKEPRIRDARRNKFTGVLTFLLPKNISLTTSYAYFNSKIKQDLVYHEASANNDQVDKNAVYKDSSNNYAVDMTYMPTKRLDLHGGISLTHSRADFSPSYPAAIDPVSIGSFSKLKTRETEYTLSGGYDLRHGWKADLSYGYSKFDNLIENPQSPDASDSSAQIVLLTISKRWQ